MAVVGKQVTVGATATRLDTATPTAGDPTIGSSVMVRAASVSIFLGGSDVTPATGFELLTGEATSVDLGRGEGLYAVVASGTSVVDVLETGV